MQKLTLDPDTLRVQSFAPAPDLRLDERILTALAATRPQVCDPVTAWCA
jgi:hypothetical protein